MYNHQTASHAVSRYGAGTWWRLHLALRCGGPPSVSGIRRSDDMLTVKASTCPIGREGEKLVHARDPARSGSFSTNPPGHQHQLELMIEHGEGRHGDGIGDLAARIKRSIKEKLVFTPDITMIPPNTLERSEYKINYFERVYEKNN